MGRNKCRGRGLSYKRDTPVKPARRDRKVISHKHNEAIPEEPEVEMMIDPTVKPASPVWTSIKPVLHLNCPAYTENPRHKAVSPATPADKKSGCQVSPARHPTTIQMTPDPEAFKGGEVSVKEEEELLAVTLESVTSSSMETDTTFSFDDDEDERYSSASSSSSSLPSPEIFRKENYVETLTFPNMEDLLGVHLHIKNSTLLDVSHAEPIHMHHTPNLSTIMGASTILVEKNCEMSNHRGPETESKIQTDKQEEAFKWKTPVKVKSSGCLLQLTNKRPILCKKKVSFKTPIIAETFETKHVPATKLTHGSESVQTPGPARPTKPDAETSRAGEINSEDDNLHLRVMLRRPVERRPEKAKFFDFVSDTDRDVFFQRMRERCVKLRNTPLFPLTAAEHREASTL